MNSSPTPPLPQIDKVDPYKLTYEDIGAMCDLLGITVTWSCRYDPTPNQSLLDTAAVIVKDGVSVEWIYHESDPWDQRGGPPWLWHEMIKKLLDKVKAAREEENCNGR